MDPDDIEELAMEFQGKTVGGWGLVQLAAGTGFAAYVMWAGVLMPGFRRVSLKLQLVRKSLLPQQQPELSASQFQSTAEGCGPAQENRKITTKEVANKIELARLEAEENEKKHQRLLQLKKFEREAEEKAKEEAHKRAMELREKEMKHELELARARPDTTANPNNPSPGTTSHPRKFPTYKAGDDTEAFLENFERACLGYSIAADQYMVELKPQLSGSLAEVAAEMPKEHMNSYDTYLYSSPAQTEARWWKLAPVKHS